jgi:hypothetical protein
VSHFVEFKPACIGDLFSAEALEVHLISEEDVALRMRLNGSTYNLHIFSNEVEGREMFGLSLGRDFSIEKSPILFEGLIESVEIGFFIDDTNWDFLSLKLAGSNGDRLKVVRYDDSFPEPTLRLSPEG